MISPKNSRGSCCFHPGMFLAENHGVAMLRVAIEEAVEDEEYWYHYDGPIDTEENRDDHPEGFVYGCCEKHFREEG